MHGSLRFLTVALLGLTAVGVSAFGAPLAAQEGPGAPSADSPFVFVNTQAILPQVPGAQEAQETFNEEIARYNEEVQRLRSEVDSLMQSYRQQEGMLSAAARQERQDEIISKQQELAGRVEELNDQADRRQQELLSPLVARVREVIEAIRMERGYAIVFDIAESGLVAADPSLDITPLVLQRLTDQEESASSPPSR